MIDAIIKYTSNLSRRRTSVYRSIAGHPICLSSTSQHNCFYLVLYQVCQKANLSYLLRFSEKFKICASPVGNSLELRKYHLLCLFKSLPGLKKKMILGHWLNLSLPCNVLSILSGNNFYLVSNSIVDEFQFVYRLFVYRSTKDACISPELFIRSHLENLRAYARVLFVISLLPSTP